MDILCKKIIRELQERSKKLGEDYSCSLPDDIWQICNTNIDSFASDIGFSVCDVYTAVEYLLKENFLEYCTMQTHYDDFCVNYGFRLSHKGKYSKQFELQEIKRYIADKWIDLLALIISIIALIQSCIALSS